MQLLPAPLRPLADYSHFIVWRAVWDASKNKFQKYPVCPITGDNIDHLNPKNWMSYAVAKGIADSQGLGVGFILSTLDPFFVVDLDNVLLPDGNWSPLALELCQAFGGAAIEISYSGKGLHIFGVGQWPEGHRCKNKDFPQLEFYTEGRFIAITGTRAVGNAYQECTAGINHLIARYLPERESHSSESWTSAPVPEWDGPADDDELIKKMLAAKSSMAGAKGSRATFVQLWNADADALGNCYPSSSGDLFDRSAADAALCQHLAFWTGKDCERMQRLFERSALVRPKWLERDVYREDSITSAASWCKDVYKARRKIDKPEPAPYAISAEVPEGVIRDGFQYLGVPQQLEHFRGCVYVVSKHAVKLPSGHMLTAERFKAAYGGYWFAMDSIGDKSSKNAWEVFTESQATRFPRADFPCFRPELPVNAVVQEDGVTFVNTYVPVQVSRLAGDPRPFLDHLARLIPDANDRAILLAFMATCVQHPGTKLRWCPFIQGTHGNGKSTISEVVAAAIGRRYCYSPRASEISSKFNAWAENKLFIYVEDVYTRDRQETIEALKPLITQNHVAIEGKGQDQYLADNRFNFILNSNHQDGYTKTKEDRRIAPFFTNQQSPEDMIRDGMDARYFRYLSEWLLGGGFSVMAEYLHTYQVPEALDPRYMERAPKTTSTDSAIVESYGVVEQEVVEAIEQCRPGFANGWVSSFALDRLLEDKRITSRVAQNKRTRLLQTLGYIPHPGLPNGRCSTLLPIEGGGRPRLYIKQGHLASQLQGHKNIVDAYTKAQEVGGVVDNASVIFNKG